jgi:hypothetical protein
MTIYLLHTPPLLPLSLSDISRHHRRRLHHPASMSPVVAIVVLIDLLMFNPQIARPDPKEATEVGFAAFDGQLAVASDEGRVSIGGRTGRRGSSRAEVGEEGKEKERGRTKCGGETRWRRYGLSRCRAVGTKWRGSRFERWRAGVGGREGVSWAVPPRERAVRMLKEEARRREVGKGSQGREDGPCPGSPPPSRCS